MIPSPRAPLEPELLLTFSGQRADGTVSFGAVTDPSSVDTAAGFRYAYDFDNNGPHEIGGSTYAAYVPANPAHAPAPHQLVPHRVQRHLVGEVDGVAVRPGGYRRERGPRRRASNQHPRLCHLALQAEA